MKLPNLPKKNNKKESDFGTTIFRPWFEKHSAEFESASWELKDTQGKDHLNFSEVKERQVDSALRNISEKGNLIRVMVASTGTADYLSYRKAKAFVVIRYPLFFCLIRIQSFLHTRSTSTRKSLTSAEAVGISELVIHLKR